MELENECIPVGIHAVRIALDHTFNINPGQDCFERVRIEFLRLGQSLAVELGGSRGIDGHNLASPSLSCAATLIIMNDAGCDFC